MYKVWHVDKYKVTFKLVINHWTNEILWAYCSFLRPTNIFLLRAFPLWNIYSWKLFRKLKWQIPGAPLAARYNWCQGPVQGRGPAVEKLCIIARYWTLSWFSFRLYNLTFYFSKFSFNISSYPIYACVSVVIFPLSQIFNGINNAFKLFMFNCNINGPSDFIMFLKAQLSQVTLQTATLWPELQALL